MKRRFRIFNLLSFVSCVIERSVFQTVLSYNPLFTLSLKRARGLFGEKIYTLCCIISLFRSIKLAGQKEKKPCFFSKKMSVKMLLEESAFFFR